VRLATAYLGSVCGAGRRFSPAVAACVALWLAAPAHALPLASSPPAVGPAAGPPDSGAAPRISVWNFVHPDSPEQAEPAAESPALPAAKPAAPAEPSWVAGPVSARAADADESNELSPSAPGGETPQYTYAHHRSVRHSSGGERASRPDTEPCPAVIAGFSPAPPPRLRRAGGGPDPHSDQFSASRLFRPPRVETRLP